MNASSATMRIRELIADVNNAPSERLHIQADAFLNGYVEALRNFDIPYDWTDADLHHQGADADRPMCLGVLLDWKPEAENGT